MIELLHLEPRPLGQVLYLNARRGGGTETLRLGLTRARVRGLPEGLDALITASDLQGIVPDPRTGEAQLLGVAVAEALDSLDEVLPPASRTGVVLAGDLYSVPEANRRGGFGDVSPVWASFAERFAFVVGVAGNHDDVSAVRGPNVHLLDTEVTMLFGLRVGGVGLVGGDAAKPGRRAEMEQLERVALVASEKLDLLVLHEGPAGEPRQAGNPALSDLVVEHGVPLTVCGHAHWGEPLWRHPRGQVLNVDGRVVVLTR